MIAQLQPKTWEVDESIDADDEEVFIVVSGTEDVVAMCPAIDDDWDNLDEMPIAMANARLMAASPELLDALLEVLDWANDGFRVALRPDQMAKINAAITKALPTQGDSDAMA